MKSWVRTEAIRSYFPRRLRHHIARALPAKIRARIASYILAADVIPLPEISFPQRMIDEVLDAPEQAFARLEALRAAVKPEERDRVDAVFFDNVLLRHDIQLLRKYYSAILSRYETNNLMLTRAEAEFLLAKFDNAALTFSEAASIRVHPSRQSAINLMHGVTSLIRSYEPNSRAGSARRGSPFYVLHSSLPQTINGYASRSHALAKALQRSGQPVRPVSVDRSGGKNGITQATIQRGDFDGVEYLKIHSPVTILADEVGYADHFTRGLCKIASDEEYPSVIHAASNYQTGLPALLAARRLGVPFIYEVRGLWEVTRLSHEPEFGRTRRFFHQRAMETYVAQSADAVLALNAGLRDELVRRGVDTTRIHIVPNGVDAARFTRRSPDPEIRKRLGIASTDVVIGYVGSLVPYEGLDDLIYAVALLAKRDVKILVVGDGAAGPDLRSLAEKVGISQQIIFTGRVDHDQVESHYSIIDICPFPRKPLQVCEMVTPLKPFEAMAMEKVVIVSDVAALKEIVDDRKTGFVFKAGSIFALKECLEQAIGMSDTQRQELGQAARSWVESERTWAKSAQIIKDVYSDVLSRRSSHDGREQDRLSATRG